jgi:regulatory protein
MSTSTYREALSVATHFCSESEHCTQEVKDKLKRFELSEEELETLFTYLISENYLNELRFVKAYTNDKVRFAKWGKHKIKYLLQQKKVAESLISEAFEEIETEVYQNNLKTLLQQKARSIKSKTSSEHKSKLVRFAQGRGFEPEIIWKILGAKSDDTDE